MSPLVYFTKLFGVVMPQGIVMALYALQIIDSVKKIFLNPKMKGTEAMTKIASITSNIFNVVRNVPTVGALGITSRIGELSINGSLVPPTPKIQSLSYYKSGYHIVTLFLSTYSSSASISSIVGSEERRSLGSACPHYSDVHFNGSR